jgi:8-oxo-dGTP pyrophosphatase MutT (NUDIX family)
LKQVEEIDKVRVEKKMNKPIKRIRKKSSSLRKKVVSAGFVVYKKTEEGTKFLLLYRGRNTWDMPRGKMEEDERSLQTAFREVKEETGLSRKDLKMQTNFKEFEKFPYNRGKEKMFKVVIFYLAEANKDIIRISDEHDGYAWFNLNDAKRHLSRFKVRAGILRKAWDHIKKKTEDSKSRNT